MAQVYRIVSASTPLNMAEQVNSLLKSGWTLVGGLVVTGQFYAQAMLYTDKEKKVS